MGKAAGRSGAQVYPDLGVETVTPQSFGHPKGGLIASKNKPIVIVYELNILNSFDASLLSGPPANFITRALVTRVQTRRGSF